MGKADANLQQRLRADDQRAIEEVYQNYKGAFLQYARKWKLAEADLLDVYQDAVITLYQQFVMRQLVLESSTIKTYLFGIGKNLLLRKTKEQSGFDALQMEEVKDEILEADWQEEKLTKEQQLLARYFGKLGDKCQEILKFFYYQGFSIREIVQFSHYKDENTVKSHKSRCLKRLKQLINTAS